MFSFTHVDYLFAPTVDVTGNKNKNVISFT